MFKTVKRIFALLALDEHKQLYTIIAVVMFASLLDLVGVVSIFPFLSVISRPELIQDNDWLKFIYENCTFGNINLFFIALGLVTFSLMLASNVFRALSMLLLVRFTWRKHCVLSRALLSRYLHEPYAFFLNRNSSELSSYLMTEVGRVVSCVLVPSVHVFVRAVLTILIFSCLIAINPMVAVLVLAVLGGGYAIIYAIFRRRLATTGEELLARTRMMFKVLNEAFGGIKDIKLLGKEQVFIDRFSKPANEAVKYYCSQFLISQLPRYVFEVLAFGGLLIITIYLIVIKNDYHQVIPIVGLYAFAGYRLMPAFQQLFQDLASIRYGQAALNTVYKDFEGNNGRFHKITIRERRIFPFSKSIEFRNVTFQYPGSKTSVIKNFSLVIQAKTTVGFVGGTGAGKTTVVDILLGLLSPQEGQILVDDNPLDKSNFHLWQANIGYVPQHIYLCDDTVCRNIAFGIPDNEIDHDAVQQAAELANIHGFIENALPHGYDTEVGERGVRLSGGERQRIGIARALYYKPSLLVFDEATSALDGITEDVILEAIYRLSHKKTIIIIAHRFSTVKECDIIFMLEHGDVIASGNYDTLLSGNQRFREMAHEYEKNPGMTSSFVRTSKVTL